MDGRRYRMDDDSGHRKPGEKDDVDLDPESRSQRKRFARRQRHKMISWWRWGWAGRGTPGRGRSRSSGSGRGRRSNGSRGRTCRTSPQTTTTPQTSSATSTFGGGTQEAAAVTQGSIASLLKERWEGAGDAELGGHAHTGNTRPLIFTYSEAMPAARSRPAHTACSAPW